MGCHTCEYINAEIMRKAKAAADALLSLARPDDTTASRETTGTESSSDTPTAAV